MPVLVTTTTVENVSPPSDMPFSKQLQHFGINVHDIARQHESFQTFLKAVKQAIVDYYVENDLRQVVTHTSREAHATILGDEWLELRAFHRREWAAFEKEQGAEAHEGTW